MNPICTPQAECPLHTVSLSDVIGAGKPVAVLFATPALCTSAYCGPVLDEMLDVMGPYQDRVTFVHVDIYKSLTNATPVADGDGVEAAERAVALRHRRRRHGHVAHSTPRSARPRWWRCSTGSSASA